MATLPEDKLDALTKRFDYIEAAMSAGPAAEEFVRLSKEYAELLFAAGVCTVKELKYRNPAKLAQAMADANKKRKMVRLLPSEKVVCRWIENAKKLPIKISY